MLHVLNGDVVAGGLARAGVSGTLAVWADPLHEGPVPPDDDLDRWVRTRARFIARCGWADELVALARYAGWRAALDSFRAFDDVVLWFEHDLFDQLLLVRHLAWFARQAELARSAADSAHEARLSLICIGAFPGIDRFDGLGQLEPAQLAGLLPQRQPVTDEQLALGRSVWRAFTSPDPLSLQRVASGDTSALPFLAGALERLLEEYPSVLNGVGRTEQQVLAILARAPRSAAALFAQNQQREERLFMGDATFWLRLRHLAHGPAPLVRLHGGASDREIARSEVEITTDGWRVLGGRADRIDLAGIDRWIGGMHLSGAPDWRWDGEARRIVSRHRP